MPNDDLGDPAMTVVYGLDTCEDTTRAREVFDAAGHPYRYVRLDIDTDVRDRLHARDLVATPVVVTPAGGLWVEPSDEVLAEIVAATA